MRVTINPAWSHAIPRFHITLSFVLNGKDSDFHFLVHPPCNELKSKSRACAGVYKFSDPYTLPESLGKRLGLSGIPEPHVFRDTSQ
jgi:hypothetical protein